MPGRARQVFAAAAAAAVAAVAGAPAAAEKPQRMLFRATLTANVSAALAYGTQETADGCTYQTTAGGSVALAVSSARPTTVVARLRRVGGVRLSGTLTRLTATPSYGFVNTHRRPVACDDDVRATHAVLAHCDSAVALPVRNLSAAFTLARGKVSFAEGRDELLAGRVRSCQGPDPDVGRGGLELASGALAAAQIRDPTVRRIVVTGAFATSQPLGPPYRGAVERRVTWTLTLARVPTRR